MELTLEAVESLIRGMTPAKRDQLERKVRDAGILNRVWLPQPGPQTEAYHSPADELLYGGAAGGGKSALLQGLATTAHQNSVIFRLQSNDLDGLWDELTGMLRKKGQLAANNGQKKVARTADGRTITGAHLEKPGSEKNHQGRPRDFMGFDEAAQLDEFKVNFVMQWLRSTTPGQRKRAVFATNPPIPELRNGVMVDTGVGDWLLRWFAPWLDELYPDPAEPGELRWCFMVSEGDRLTTIWVDGPGHYDPETHRLVPDATPEDIDNGRVAVARSRTFIKSLLKDNVFLKGTGYAERLSSTPEPLKSMLLLGRFDVKGEDHPFQIIPTNWVLAAQRRWMDRQMDPDLRKLIMLVLFADVAQGGADTSVTCPLYTSDYFGEIEAKPGRDTPTGVEVGTMIIARRQHNAIVGLDGTGGWAGSTSMWLKTHHEIDSELVVASHGSTEWTSDGRFKFLNKRAEDWWRFREALSPDQSDYAICLPPGSRLRAQLTAPHWQPKGKHLVVESKDEIRARIGSSTDEADTVIGAWGLRETALTRPQFAKTKISIIDRLNGRGEEYQERQRTAPIDDYDPLKDW